MLLCGMGHGSRTRLHGHASVAMAPAPGRPFGCFAHKVPVTFSAGSGNLSRWPNGEFVQDARLLNRKRP